MMQTGMHCNNLHILHFSCKDTQSSTYRLLSTSHFRYGRWLYAVTYCRQQVLPAWKPQFQISRHRIQCKESEWRASSLFKHFWFCMWKQWPKPKDHLHFTHTALDRRFCRWALHDSHDGDAGRGTTAHPTCLQLHPHRRQCEEHTQWLSLLPPSRWNGLPNPY